MGAFSVTIQDIVAREHVISEKARTPIRMEPFHHYGAQAIDLPVIQIDVALPVYRMANWRTRMKQLEYVHRELLSHEYFQSGEENTGAQRAQHEILIEFANRGRGDRIIPIMEKLRQDRRQMEALLVTASGVVVNGNRRLAGMRELFAEDPGSYPFQSIEVAVLPAGLTAQEVKKIEFQLQMQQETKLPYDWAIECLSVRELADSGVSKQEIKHMMRLDKVSEIQAMINRLNEAEMYLRDYLGAPDNYSAIEGQQQQFKELEKALDRKSDVGEKELARKMCYVLTKHSRELEDRAYDFKIAFGPKATQVAERLAERMELELPDASAAAAQDDEDNDVFSDEAASQTAVRFQPVCELLGEQTQSKELAEAITEICIEINEEDQGEEDARKPLKQVRRVKSVLTSIEIDRAADNTIEDIRSELTEIISLAQGLLAQTSDGAEGAN